MRCGFRPHDRDRTTESMEGSLRASGMFGGVLGCKERGAFAVTRLTVGASNDLKMERNLTGGLPAIYQGHSANLGPFREHFLPLTKQGPRGATGACECVCAQNGQWREPGEPERMQVLKNM